MTQNNLLYSNILFVAKLEILILLLTGFSSYGKKGMGKYPMSTVSLAILILLVVNTTPIETSEMREEAGSNNSSVSSDQRDVGNYKTAGCLLGGIGGTIVGMAVGCSIASSHDNGDPENPWDEVFSPIEEGIKCMGGAFYGGIIGGLLGGFLGRGIGGQMYEGKQKKKIPSEYKNPLEGSSSVRFQVISFQRNSSTGVILVAQYSF